MTSLVLNLGTPCTLIPDIIATILQKAKNAAPKRSEGGPKYQPFQIALPATTHRLREMNFYYVYIPESIAGGAFYVGFTEDLQTRLKTHNAGSVPHTAKHRPWQIKTAIAFTDKTRALDFERYLKSSSGRAFAKKRL